MNYELHIATYGVEYAMFACGRIFCWKSANDSKIQTVENADTDILVKSGPGERADVLQHVLSMAVSTSKTDKLRVYCFDVDNDALHVAAQRLNTDTILEIISVGKENLGFSAQCRLMQEFAEKEYVKYDIDKEE